MQKYVIDLCYASKEWSDVASNYGYYQQYEVSDVFIVM